MQKVNCPMTIESSSWIQQLFLCEGASDPQEEGKGKGGREEVIF